MPPADALDVTWQLLADADDARGSIILPLKATWLVPAPDTEDACCLQIDVELDYADRVSPTLKSSTSGGVSEG